MVNLTNTTIFALSANALPLTAPDKQNVFSRVSYPPKALAFKQDHLQKISSVSLNQIRCAVSSFMSVKSTSLTYVSCPISSGKALYNFMKERNYQTLQEAKASPDYFKEVIAYNIARAEQVTDLMSSRETVIAPSSFEKKFYSLANSPLAFGQAEFMSMWIPVIEKTVTKLKLLEGWPYSNGSVEEYLAAVMMQMGYTERNNINIVNESDVALGIDEGLSLLLDAYEDLTERNLQSDSLKQVIESLIEAEELHRTNPPLNSSLPVYNLEIFIAQAKKFTEQFCELTL